ncbi:MAG: hypothetical protein RLZ98_2589, partial [Pseudomonadota bacterium]
MYAFEFTCPSSLDEARRLLQSDNGAILIAGGQTLLPTLRQRLARPSRLVDLAKVDGLVGITRNGSDLRIGAMTTHAAVATSSEVAEAIPALADLASR